MPEPNDNQTVLTILENFNGLTSLKMLQAQLNLDREDAPIPRRGWKEATQALLLADPVITASIGGNARALFGEEQSFKVIYCRLSSPDLRMMDERTVVAELQGQYPYALFVFSDQAQRRFHFLNVKDGSDGQTRRLFRRITVGSGERLRTAAEQLARLDGETLKHLPLSGIQARFDEAFDVGPVTKRFFAEYKRVFDLVKAGIQGFSADQAGEEACNLFTQRLFNRLMFLAFVQKKGWLRFNGNVDYLCTLWTAHQRDTFANKGSFYEGRLKPLFFLGLNTGPSEVNLVGINGGGSLTGLIGDVPYLNGGLFEKDADDDNPEIKVLDAGLDAVINDLFERFNFTITESTPLDIEVAVDPEMLGKIFEELVTGRHESGSYYTPKPIVSFMCREALKGYLETQVASESETAIARFVDRHEPDDIQDAEGVLNALRHVSVCDPACGSGAYLLGMLHELLDLRESLFRTRRLDHPAVYDRKLEIISRNIYGIDADQFAVNIARLRLWLSLSIDYAGTQPPPLPNLDYKIESGDSIASIAPGAAQAGLHQQATEQMLRVKSRFLRSHHAEKIALRIEIEELRRDIRRFSGRPDAQFDWVIDFAEVFIDGGFDIAVANPPYINAIEFTRSYPVEYRRAINAAFLSARGAYDFYIPFFERALQLLKPNGQLAFITPNKYLSAKYAVALRAYILDNAKLLAIADVSAAEIFTSAAVYPVVTFLAKGKSEEEYETSGYRLRDPRVSDLSSIQKVTFKSGLLNALPENIWGFLLSDDFPLLAKVLRQSASMETLGKINATSTAAESDQFTELLSDVPGPQSLRVVNTGTIDPLQSLWGAARLTHSGVRLLTPYLNLDSALVPARRREMYRSPKLIFGKMGRVCEALLDGEGEYASMNTNCFYEPLATHDLYFLAAYCNSKLFMFLYDQFFRALRMAGGYYQFQAPQLRVMPVPILEENDRREVGRYASVISQCSNDEERQQLFEELNACLLEKCQLSLEEKRRVLEL